MARAISITNIAIVVAKEAQGPDHGLNTLGNLANVGYYALDRLLTREISEGERR
jgi:hypothetical protein